MSEKKLNRDQIQNRLRVVFKYVNDDCIAEFAKALDLENDREISDTIAKELTDRIFKKAKN